MTVLYTRKGDLFREAARKILPTEVVLDIGCGIQPQQFFSPRVHICYEPYGEYIEHLRRSGAQYQIKQGTWDDAVRTLKPKSVDSVFLLDVIKHFKKEEGRALLKKTEEIARKQIVIFTPLGFMPQHHADGTGAWGFKGGAWQEHRSGWDTNDFDASWNLYIAKQYHYEDNQGRKLEAPYGALFAIKNLAVHREKTSSAEPRVSVIIPFYNRIKWAGEAVQSVLQQTMQDFEIILVDDGSSENIADSVDLSHPKILYHKQENKGPAAARNLGMDQARGEYIAFLDSDDLYLPRMLEHQVAVMDANPEVILAHTSYNLFDQNYELHEEKDSGTFTGKVFPRILFDGCSIACSTVLLRRSALQPADRFNEALRIGEDVVLWHQITERGSIIGTNEVLAYVRLHGDNAAYTVDHIITGTNNVFGIAIARYRNHGKLFTAKLHSKKNLVLADLHFLQHKWLIGLHSLARAFAFYPFHTNFFRIPASHIKRLLRKLINKNA